MREMGGDGETFEGKRGLFRVGFDRTDERMETGGERIVPDDIVEGGLHDGCF